VKLKNYGTRSQVSGILNNTELNYHAMFFFVELKPAPNDKDKFSVEYIIVQKKIQTTQTQKGYCSVCKLSKIWAHQKLLPSRTEMSNAQVTTWQAFATKKKDE
jgi:hypothetical protein